MSVQLVRQEVDRFLSTKDPEVISISGRWGVGKTFAWNCYLDDARRKRQIALGRYSYVSLFGVNSLDELKYSIFENSVMSSTAGLEPSVETLRSNTTAVAERLGKKSLWFLQQFPWVKGHIGGLGPLWFLSIAETIICLDDIERHGEHLRVRDVLGLVSSLKEQKRCKVVLILNDEALEQGVDKADFDVYLEKVVDTSLKFEPSAAECAAIALTADTETNKLLAENCVTLGISNIRVIRKIERAALRVKEMLANFDEQVLRQAIQSLALIGWSVYEPKRAPPVEYLKARIDRVFASAKNQPITETEAAWNALLDAYGFLTLDEFDLALLDGVQKGLFDPVQIKERALLLDKRARTAKAANSFEDAWRRFHDSFADNQEQVLDGVHQAALTNIEYMSALDLNGAVWLLRELGRPAQAAEVITRYTEVEGRGRNSFNLDILPFRKQVDQPNVIQAFRDKYAELKDERDPTTIMLSIANSHGWSEMDLGALSTLDIEEYYGIFKRLDGVELRKVIDACLQFDRIAGGSEMMQEVSKRARQALRKIGEESSINALRVRKYGIEVAESA